MPSASSDYVVPFGKYSGMPLRHLALTHIFYARWLVDLDSFKSGYPFEHEELARILAEPWFRSVRGVDDPLFD